MILAVYASHSPGDRVALPLTAPSPPLVRWTAGAGRRARPLPAAGP